VSQGTLQALFEYQSLICDLTGMEVANASMYDGGSATAEAALMACRLTGRNAIGIADTTNPQYIEVLRTYFEGQSLQVEVFDADDPPADRDLACLIIQHPNFFGYLERPELVAARAREAGALLVMIVDPISLGLLKPPGEYGADIVVAEGQSLGLPPYFGGACLGIFACRQEHIRQMPGRLVGQTVDIEGRRGFVLTLQTREQHIRRERATSNICTSQSLLAIAAAAYLAALGKQGLRAVAEQCYHKAHYAAKLIAQIPGYSLAFDRPFFKEFVIRCPAPVAEISRFLLGRRIIGGLDVSDYVPNGMLIAVTELNTRAEIERLAEALRDAAAVAAGPVREVTDVR
jgi:glycine dehydrogenase subunit 1